MQEVVHGGGSAGCDDGCRRCRQASRDVEVLQSWAVENKARESGEREGSTVWGGEVQLGEVGADAWRWKGARGAGLKACGEWEGERVQL